MNRENNRLHRLIREGKIVVEESGAIYYTPEGKREALMQAQEKMFGKKRDDEKE